MYFILLSVQSKLQKMADGGKAGINTRDEHRSAKNDKFAKSNMAAIIQDAMNQGTVYREKGTGKKRDFEKEHAETEEERLRKEEELKNYKVWNKGKIQLAQREENVSSKCFFLTLVTEVAEIIPKSESKKVRNYLVLIPFSELC